jgi:hypothetical protein
MAKQIFAASSTGAGNPVPCSSGAVISLTISATGNAQLQIYMDGDWVNIRTADTASIALATVVSLPVRDEPYLLRWNVTANAGTITTYID